MRKLSISMILAAALVLVAASCAKTVSENSGYASQRAFESWLEVHDYGQTEKIGHGIYIISDIPGTGECVPDSAYMFLHFNARTMEDSTLASYTERRLAEQMGTYTAAGYYGLYTYRNVLSELNTGVLDMVKGGGKWEGMRPGGRRAAIVPGWLTSSSVTYDTEQEYIDNVSGSDYIYEMYVDGYCLDIEKWQQDTIQKVMLKSGKIVSDSTTTGVWYYRDRAREEERGVTVLDTVTFPSDTTIYIDYIGRLINGKVFDTTIEDTAKMYNIYDASSTYEPVSITWSSDSTSIQMSSSSVINGFAFTLWEMHPYESGRGIFPARLGYGSSGSSPSIPGYAPLIFDIDIVDAP